MTNLDSEPELRRRIGVKLILFLIVPIALITFVNSIDRVNVSYAGSAMSAELGLTPEQFGRGVSIFFVAYLLFQYPHVWLLRVLGIKRWIFASMVLWGCSGLLMSQVRSAEAFYAARFLLGVAEAGFAPGMTWLISQWAPPSLRARALSGALVAVPLSMVLGGPLCGWLLGVDNPLGLSPWRFMFLMVAAPNFVLAVAAAFYFVDGPEKVGWLNEAEKDWLSQERRLQGEGLEAKQASLWSVARDPWLWRCCAAWLMTLTGSYALVYWLPQLVRSLDLGSSELMIGTLSALPLLGLAIGLVVNGRRSDRTGERLLHVGIPSAAAGVIMIVAAFLPTGWPLLALLTLAGFGVGAAQGVFWTIPSAVRLGGDTVPVGVIALISMFGTAGGVIGPYVTGVLVGETGGFSLAITVLASLMILVLPVVGFDPSGRAARQTRGSSAASPRRSSNAAPAENVQVPSQN